MRDFATIVLSLAILAAYFLTGYLLLNSNVDPQNAMLVYGSVSTSAGVVIAYWFGTNKSSADKDKTISSMATGTGNGNTSQEQKP